MPFFSSLLCEMRNRLSPYGLYWGARFGDQIAEKAVCMDKLCTISRKALKMLGQFVGPIQQLRKYRSL
jgi:hypothetical protein